MPKSTEGKRAKRPEEWKKNIRKLLRQSGQEYVGVTGKVVSRREVQPGCCATCYLSCHSKISSEERRTIHNMFWKLTDNQKNYFYWKYTSRIIPKRRRQTTAEEIRRGYTFKYRFEIKGEFQYVCSKFFYATLDISPRRIYYFYNNCFNEEICMPRLDIMPVKGRKLGQQLEQDGINHELYLQPDTILPKINMCTESMQESFKQCCLDPISYNPMNLEFQMSDPSESPCNYFLDKEVRVESHETNTVHYVLHQLQPATEALQEWNTRNNIQVMYACNVSY